VTNKAGEKGRCPINLIADGKDGVEKRKSTVQMTKTKA